MKLHRLALMPTSTRSLCAYLVVTCITLWFTNSFALGIGNIRIRSALNERFNADIALDVANASDLENLQVTLAKSVDFARAGLDLPYLLTQLKFKIVKVEGGRSVVRVTSRLAIREPFLNFLVEANWPKGRLLKKFTVLLDPKPNPRNSSVTSPTTSAAQTTNHDRGRGGVPHISDSNQKRDVKPIAITGVPKINESSSAKNGGRWGVPHISKYGPVPPGSTIMGIARNLRAKGVDIGDVVMSLFRNNPHAFVDKNMHRLKSGAILSIPNTDAALFNLSDTKVPRAVVSRKSHTNNSGQERVSTLNIGSTTTDRSQIATPGTQSLASSKKNAAGFKSSSTSRPDSVPTADIPVVAEVRTDPMTVLETAESDRQETENLREKIRELEGQLNEFRILVKSQVEQMAQLQTVQSNSPGGAWGVPTSPGGAWGVPTSPDLRKPQALPDVMGGVGAGASPTATSMQQVPSPASAIPAPVPSLQSPEVIGSAANTTATTGTSQHTNTSIPKPKTASGPTAVIATSPTMTVPVSSPSWLPFQVPDLWPTLQAMGSWLPAQWVLPTLNIDMGLLYGLSRDPLNQALVAGGVLALLLGLIGMWWLTRSKEQTATEHVVSTDSDMLALASAMSQSGIVDEHFPSTQTKKSSSLEETSFLSDFSPSNMQDLQQETGEVDPAAEADVYIAYGRYQQAETLLKQTLADAPDRLDLQLKLLDIYYTTRNVAEFTNLAEDMDAKNLSNNDPQAWDRICSMGRELLPGHAMFGMQGRQMETKRIESVTTKNRSQEDARVDMEDLSNLDLNLDTVLSEMPNLSELEAIKAKSVQTVVTAPQSSNRFQAYDDLAINVIKPANGDVGTPHAPFTSLPTTQPIVKQARLADASDDVAKPSPIVTESTHRPQVLPEINILDVGTPHTPIDLDFSQMASTSELDRSMADIDLSLLGLGTDSSATSSEFTSSQMSVGDAGTYDIMPSGHVDENDSIFSLDDLDLGTDISMSFDIGSEEPPEQQLHISDLKQPLPKASGRNETIDNKLELAKAFADIDHEAARGLLEEVIRDGEPNQQAEAKKLLEQLD